MKRFQRPIRKDPLLISQFMRQCVSVGKFHAIVMASYIFPCHSMSERAPVMEAC